MTASTSKTNGNPNAATLRQLSIKTGVVRRLFKEEQTYADEAEQQAQVLAKLKEDGADGADIRNAERVLKDSQQMIPRTKKSLEEAVVQLEDLVAALKDDGEVRHSNEFEAAFEQLQQIEAAWKSDGN